MSDLENLRHACARAQIFQVRQQDSKGIEHSMYRKTVLTHFEEKRQHPATYGWTYSRPGVNQTQSALHPKFIVYGLYVH